MKYRLLVDADVIEFLQGLPAQERRRVYQYLRRIQQYPGNCSHITTRDDLGRQLDVSSFGQFNIYYWMDSADQHVKILEIREVDQGR